MSNRSEAAVLIAYRVYTGVERVPQEGDTYLMCNAFADFERRHGFPAEGAISHNDAWWMLWGKDEQKYQEELRKWEEKRYG